MKKILVADEEKIKEALNLKRVSYMPKPFKNEELEAKVKKLLKNKNFTKGQK